MAKSLLLVGCGRMGSALLSGVAKTQQFDDIYIIEPHSIDASLTSQAYTTHYTELSELPKDVSIDVVILAVKPQVIGDMLAAYKTRFDADTIYISIIAGKTLGFFENHLNDSQPIIRTMPNLPITVNEGMVVGSANAHVTDAQKSQVAALFEAAGSFFWADSEDQLDVVTAISGSGPAYFFHFMESMIEAGQKLGLSKEQASQLVYATAHGSTTLAKEALNKGTTVTQLREQVTSPAGTTAAALDIFMNGKPSLQSMVESACEKACKRAGELNS